MAQKIRIRLKAYDHEVLDQSTKQNEPEKKPPEAQSDATVQAIMTILNQAPPQ